MGIYVIVADSARARVLSAEAGVGELQDERDFVHPESRLRQQDLVSDAGGKDAGAYGQHSMGHEKSAQEHAADSFARELVAEIENLRLSGNLNRLYLIAAPRFLGLLRGHLGKPCRELVAGEIDRDLVSHSIEDIRSHLPARL